MSALHAIDLDAQNPNTLPGIVAAFIGPVLRLRASSEGEYSRCSLRASCTTPRRKPTKCCGSTSTHWSTLSLTP